MNGQKNKLDKIEEKIIILGLDGQKYDIDSMLPEGYYLILTLNFDFENTKTELLFVESGNRTFIPLPPNNQLRMIFNAGMENLLSTLKRADLTISEEIQKYSNL